MNLFHRAKLKFLLSFRKYLRDNDRALLAIKVKYFILLAQLLILLHFPYFIVLSSRRETDMSFFMCTLYKILNFLTRVKWRLLVKLFVFFFKINWDKSLLLRNSPFQLLYCLWCQKKPQTVQPFQNITALVCMKLFSVIAGFWLGIGYPKETNASGIYFNDFII